MYIEFKYYCKECNRHCEKWEVVYVESLECNVLEGNKECNRHCEKWEGVYVESSECNVLGGNKECNRHCAKWEGVYVETSECNVVEGNKFIGAVKRTIRGKIAVFHLVRINCDFLPIENAGWILCKNCIPWNILSWENSFETSRGPR
jgi:hypothetical protein